MVKNIDTMALSLVSEVMHTPQYMENKARSIPTLPYSLS
jgi:hypothetical protein